jgi:hypothetical protein
MNFFNEMAVDEYSAMKRHLNGLKFVFGPTSPEYVKAKESFDHVQEFLDNNEGVIYRDGELSLLFVTFITCGIIWFRDKNPQYEGMYCQPGTWSIHS